MLTNKLSRYRNRGFSINEALVALLVLSFGILALVAMTARLYGGATDAKNAAEAMMLAEERVEAMRSFRDNAAWQAFSAGSQAISTAGYGGAGSNVEYTRVVSLGWAVTDPFRPVNVAVSWVDRSGNAQTVSIASVISKTLVADSGYLAFPLPQNTNLKRPFNRALNIPIPAINIGDGKSALNFPGLGGYNYVVFDNVSGGVVKLCNISGTPTADNINSVLNGEACSVVKGYLVSGYIRRGPNVSNTDWTSIQGSIGVDISGITRNAAGTRSPSCLARNAINQNDGTTISGYKSFLCIVPLEEPSPALTQFGPYNWSGKLLVSGPAIWNSPGSKFFVCRYKYLESSVVVDAQGNYQNVNATLSNQNFVINTTTNGTSTSQPVCPSDMNMTGVSEGVLHQDCRSASNAAGYLTACPTNSGAGPFDVDYDGNGATGGTPPVDNTLYSVGDLVTLAGQGNLVNAGAANFLGWSLSPTDCTSPFAAGAPFSIGSDVTFYACWSAVQSYVLSYDGNGSNGGTLPASATFPAGAVVTLPTSGPTKTGNSFRGWSDAPACTTLLGTTYTMPSSNATIFACWTALAEYTITYDGNGSGVSNLPSPVQAYAGATVTLSGNPTRTGGYSFSGWATSAACATKITSLVVSGNATVYACWTTAQTYTVTYVRNCNKTTSGTMPDSQSGTSGSSVTVAGGVGLTCNNKSLANWSTTASGQGNTVTPGSQYTITNTNLTLYARYSN